MGFSAFFILFLYFSPFFSSFWFSHLFWLFLNLRLMNGVTSAPSILHVFSWGTCSHRLFNLFFHTVSRGGANLVMDRSNLWSQEESFSLVVLLLLLPPSPVCQLRLSFDPLNRYHLRIKLRPGLTPIRGRHCGRQERHLWFWGEVEDGVWACSSNEENMFCPESMFMFS